MCLRVRRGCCPVSANYADANAANAEKHLMLSPQQSAHAIPSKPWIDPAALEKFAELDQLISRHDAEGDGPLKKGEEAFRWSTVEAGSKAILEKIADMRVGIWLLRAQVIQHGLAGLRSGLGELQVLSRMAPERVLPEADEGETPRQAHALPLGWLGGEDFLGLLRSTLVHPAASVRLGDLLRSVAVGEALTLTQRSDATDMLRESREILAEIRASIVDAGAVWDRDPVVATELMSDLIRVLALRGKTAPETTELAATTNSAEKERVGLPAGRPQDRKEIKQMLDHLHEYYINTEPAHPAPLFIARLRRMVDASFEEIMKELYAEAPALITRIKSPTDHL